MEVWKTFGHEAVKEILESQLVTGNFPHAYLWQGPASIGKKTLALEFAGRILKTETILNHPDFIFFQAADSDIDSLRGFLERLAYKPFIGQKKVAIIDNAQALSIQSANALLKTLEEPSPSTVIILVSSEKLLPTIYSRSQNLNFNSFSQARKEAFFSRYPGAKQGKVDGHMLEKLQQLPSGDTGDRLLGVEEFADIEQENLEALLVAWLLAEKMSLGRQPSNFRRMGYILDALAGLKTNKNRKLLLQSLFLKI